MLSQLENSDNLISKIHRKTARICVIGLGYVGLPTAVFFAEKGYSVTGCDVLPSIVDEINVGRSPLEDLNLDDRLGEVVKGGKLTATTETAEGVSDSDIILLILPTPTKEGFEPDLKYIISAGRSVAESLKPGQLVILESTVYPGVTEDILKPILELSGLRAGPDFGLAYCPERYNPGDADHTINKVVRIVGGIDPEWTEAAAELYAQITETFKVSSIKTAEMAKIIENTQRDLNIALMNEVALICEKLGLDVIEILKAASTKWNFHNYYPGCVGGHCLPKDPWYLVKTAEKEQYIAELVTVGRRINDRVPNHLFHLLVRSLNSVGKPVKGSKVVVLGLSYKENVGDVRNSPSLPLIAEIQKMGGTVVTCDPYVDEQFALSLGVKEHNYYCAAAFHDADAIVLMTAHSDFEVLDFDKIKNEMHPSPVVVDGRRIFDPQTLEAKGFVHAGIGRG